MLMKLVDPNWVAPIFAATLSAITLGASFLVTPQSYAVGFPAFFCFLPMAFYLVAVAQITSQKQVCELQQRIEQLEVKALEAKAAVPSV